MSRILVGTKIRQQKSRISNCTFIHRLMSYQNNYLAGINSMSYQSTNQNHITTYFHIHKHTHSHTHKTFYHIKNYNTFSKFTQIIHIHPKSKENTLNTFFRHLINTQFKNFCKLRKITHSNAKWLVGLGITFSFLFLIAFFCILPLNIKS